jgi:tetratricopeptide (TPR) repeat protein
MSHMVCHNVVRLIAAFTLIAIVGGGATAAEVSKPGPQPAAKIPVPPEQIDRLVKQLGDKDYYVRQRAQEELARLGFGAFDALTAAATHDDLEIASRAKYLLRLMRVEWTAENDPPEVKTLLHGYEFEDERSREGKMTALAALPDGQGANALCRLVRFENSARLSKAAAIALLGIQPLAEPPKAPLAAIVRKTLNGCRRPGAVWLLAWARLAAEPDAVMSEWSKLTDNERELLGRSPLETSQEIVAGLTRFQIAQLRKLGKDKEALAAIRRLVELERGNPESLAELLDWLIEQKAWQAVDDLAVKFWSRFAIEPGLLYMLAQAQAVQGQKARSEETANRAYLLYPGKQKDDLLHHWMVAQRLRQRGQFPWARREFEYVIKQGSGAESDDLRADAQERLAEMLHDQGQDLDAGSALQKLVEVLDAGKMPEAKLGRRKGSEIRARMNYFLACHWQSKGDKAKQRECLDKALAADPNDVDVLIACYRLPEQPSEYHARIVSLIKKEAASSREQIAETANHEQPTEESELASLYNEFAWLVGNTEGDLDEALKYSKKSVELMPTLGGFYDTLARVYFAKGDLAAAIKQQTKAAELDPHSGLIRRQLEFFRNKQAEQKKL